MTLFDYLQHCSKDEFVEWLYDWSNTIQDDILEQIDKSLLEQGQSLRRVELSEDLRKTIILQGLESELHAT